MQINNISFITPIEELSNKQIFLEKSYSKEIKLSNDESIFLSSNIGNRDTQQDCVAITQNGNYLLLLVSDGMGGMKNGEKASYTTASIIKQWLDSEDKDILKILNKKTLEDVLTALMYFITNNIPNYSGTTLNMSIITPTKTLIVNIGDSRTYAVKDGRIELITQDDSLVFKKYNPKTESERDRLRFHKKNNVIINSISRNNFPTIKITTIKNEDYDILCLVTDGITDILSESQIKTYLQSKNPAISLVDNSTEGLPIYNFENNDEFNKYIYPGKDNATAIVYKKIKKKNN